MVNFPTSYQRCGPIFLVTTILLVKAFLLAIRIIFDRYLHHGENPSIFIFHAKMSNLKCNVLMLLKDKSLF